MNSKNLKKTYIQTYEKFFLENQTVVSAPFVLSWSGDILNNYSGVSIKQKIPLRIYMGFSTNTSKKISINKMYHLDMNEYQFIESNALEYAPYFADINKELEKKYGKLLHGDEGIEINILSELPRGV
jgi:mevalonate kinase